MVTISSTATASVFPVDPLCLPLVDRDGLHTKDTCDILEGEIIGIDYRFQFESKRKEVTIRIRDHRRIPGLFRSQNYFLPAFWTRRNNTQSSR